MSRPTPMTARGNKLTETDALGTVTEFTYNAQSKVTELRRKDKTGMILFG